MNRVLLALATVVVVFSSCKQDEINIQQKSTSWKLKDVIHYSDNVKTQDNYIIAVEQKDGKISQITASFFGPLPSYGGKFQIVDTLRNSRQIRFTTIINSQLDSVFTSTEQIPDSAIITIGDRGKINITCESFQVYNSRNNQVNYPMSINLQQ